MADGKTVDRDSDEQTRAEWDRLLVANLYTQIVPHFIKDRDGACNVWEQMRAAIKCLYGSEHGSPINSTWCDVAVVMRAVRELQAQCRDEEHALHIHRLLGFTLLSWHYQPGVQGKTPYEGYLKAVCSLGLVVLGV